MGKVSAPVSSIFDKIAELKKQSGDEAKKRITEIDQSFLIFLKKPAGSGGLSKEYLIIWKNLTALEREKILNESRRVLEFWAREFNKTPRFALGDRKKIVERLLMSFTEQDCKDAILGCKSSSFHMGENEDGYVYNSIELIFRNDQNTNRFISYLQKPKTRLKRDEFTEFWE